MFELLVASFTIFGNIILAVVAYLNNKKSATNILFSILAIAFAGVALGTYFATNTNNPAQAIFWVRVNMFFASIVISTLFLFMHTFPKDKISLKKPYLITSILWTSFLAFLCMTPLVFREAKFEPNLVTVPGPGIALFGLSLFTNMPLAFFFLIKKYLKSQGFARAQFQFLALGLITSFSVLSGLNFLAVVLLNNTSFVNFGISSVLIFIGATAYAIVKHRLMDVRLLVARAVAFLGVVILIAGIYTAAVFGLGYFFLPVKFTQPQLLVVITFALVVALSFQTILRFFKQITDKIFFKEDYDDNELITKLSHIMAQTLDLNILLEKIAKVIMDEVKVTKLAIILSDDESVEDIHNFGFNDDIFRKKVILKNLFTKNKFLVFEDLENDEEKFLFRDLNISVCIPLSVKGREIGLLLLGEKASGDIYSSKDFNVFHILEPELAIAIENAEDYQKIKRFNITLREEVDLATAKLQTANNRLKQLDKLKDDFVSVASHELRTPMTAIKSYLWVALNQHYKELSEDMQRYLNRAYISVERLINLVNDMLNISRIEGGRIALRLADTDLAQLSREVYDEVLAKANEKNIDIVIVQKNVPKVLCDKDKIHEVLLNLIGNSLKFTKSGGTISLDFRVDNPFVTISVTDTGVGISPENLKKLFAKFGRLENSYVAIAESGGTGLGLYISRALVELHKGKIEAHSQGLDKGSTFSFTLPIVGTTIAEELSQEAPRETEGTKELEKTKLYIN